MKVAVDPGHGMSNRRPNIFDSGATHTENGTEFREADIALRYGLSLKEAFVQAGHSVFMTRDDNDDHAPVGERAGNAETAGCETFVSLHLNDYDDDAANGLEVLYRGDDDRPLAAALQDALIGVTGFVNRGIKQRSDLAVLKFNGKAVLIELGFIANDGDRNALLNPAMRASICEAVVRVVAGRSESNPVPAGGGIGGVPAPQARVAVPADDTLTVRNAPRQSGTPVGALANGTVVSLYESSGIWRRIDPVEPRWVSSRFLLPVSTGGGDDGSSLNRIVEIAANSDIARYNWPQRGVAPIGYVKGMALSFARALCKLRAGDASAVEMAKAATANAQRDVLAHYAPEFAQLGMDNSAGGAETLRHLFALMLGLGMRESSGKHCCGRDTSAGNTSSDTAEAGLFQTSWNARSCHPTLPMLFEQYANSGDIGFLDVFAEGVSCSAGNWANHGTGAGRQYQELAKKCPAFHTEFTAVALRNLRRHWGPINTKAAKIRPEADAMLGEVQALVESSDLCPV